MASNLIEHNPLLKRSLLTILSLAEQYPHEERSLIEEYAATNTGEQFLRQSPSTVVDILVRNDALEERLWVNGKVYEGTLHDIQTDVSIEDDASINQELTLTPHGKELLNSYATGVKIRELFEAKPHYIEVYQTMLEMCSAPQGCSRSALEHALMELPQLAPNAVTGEQTIYPQYFIDSLETADGIAWQGSWHTTDAGRLVR